MKSLSALLFLWSVAAIPALAQSPSCSDQTILALEIEGELTASPALANQIAQDLMLIRIENPDLADITVRPDWDPGNISVKLTPEAWASYLNGTYAELDSLNAHYGVTNIDELGFIQTLYLQFGTCYQPELLALHYAALDGVVRSSADVISGDGDDIFADQVGTYTFVRGWGDCHSGCFYHSYWEFSVSGGNVTLVRQYEDSATSVPGDPAGADSALGHSVPNPFNPRTSIRYAVAKPGFVTLEIYDVRGRQVRELVRGWVEDGAHAATWDGLDSSFRRVPSGVYFWRLVADGTLTSRRVVLLN